MIKEAKPEAKPIDHFSFWTPVVFSNQGTPGTTFLADLAWRLGSWADQYAYVGSQTLRVKAERITPCNVYFEEKKIKNIPLWQTAIKATTHVLSLLILPAVALIAKIIFKIYLNRCLTLNPNKIIAEKLIGKTKIVLLSGNLLKETVAIVNPANASLKHLGGLCHIIGKAIGQVPFKECQTLLTKQTLTNLPCGEAVMTTAGNLAPRIKVVIHAVGPNCGDAEEDKKRAELLSNAHTNILKLITAPKDHPNSVSANVGEQPMRTVAIPAISTGIFGYPKDEAASVAFKAVKDFIEANPDALDEVRFVFLPLSEDSEKTSPHYVKALEELK
jgi:O-acetyl-ADP-ribose deacetylase (regulator of RNase III)